MRKYARYSEPFAWSRTCLLALPLYCRTFSILTPAFPSTSFRTTSFPTTSTLHLSQHPSKIFFSNPYFPTASPLYDLLSPHLSPSTELWIYKALYHLHWMCKPSSPAEASCAKKCASSGAGRPARSLARITPADRSDRDGPGVLRGGSLVSLRRRDRIDVLSDSSVTTKRLARQLPPRLTSSSLSFRLLPR